MQIFDHLPRPEKVIYPDGRTMSYSYNEMGNLIKIQDSLLGTTTHHYNALGQLTKVIYPSEKKFLYSYDPAGNRVSLTYPYGEMVNYEYNPNGWLTKVSSRSMHTFFAYNKVGNLIKKILPNGIITTYNYNDAGRLCGLLISDAKGQTFYDFSYVLDRVGNYCEINKANNTIIFEYDSLSRLTRIKYSNVRHEKYKYDSMGNRLSMRVSPSPGNGVMKRWFVKSITNLGIFDDTILYTYDSEMHLIKAGNSKFKYDSKGNLVEKNTDNKTIRYTYSSDDKLIKIEYPDGAYNKYVYDALGRRTSKRNRDGKIIHYLYDCYSLVQELDENLKVITSYFYDINTGHLLSIIRGGKTYYYLLDHLGSVIALSNEKGEIIAEYEYDAWGNIIKEVEYIENPFRYRGSEWDKESGLYYFKTRYYDPCIGRYISKNPSSDSLMNPQSLNKYSYAYNNPLSYKIPFGVSPIRPLSQLRAVKMETFNNALNIKLEFGV
jgi:RHS repeat-associated protein